MKRSSLKPEYVGLIHLLRPIEINQNGFKVLMNTKQDFHDDLAKNDLRLSSRTLIF